MAGGRSLVLALTASSFWLFVFAEKEKPFVQYEMREKFRGRRTSEELYFRCNFNIHPDVNITYQVNWHIDGKLVFTSPSVTTEYLNQTFLTEENGLLLNRKISCAVNTTLGGNNTVLESQNSDTFFAGIKIKKTFLTIRRGGVAKIQFRLTVPFGCAYYSPGKNDVQNCVLNIRMMEDMLGNCFDERLNMSNCGVSIRRNNWNDIYTVRVTHIDDDVLTFLPYRRIQFETQRLISNEIWTDLRLPSVQIFIMDNFLPSLTCRKLDGSYTHMRNLTNVFTALSKTDDFENKFEIQTRRVRKDQNNNRLCGLAVRAGCDFFRLDACDEPTLRNYERCQDKVTSVQYWEGLSNIITEIQLLPGIRINIAENSMSDSLIVHICDVSELNVHEIMLNESSADLFQIEESEIDTIQCLSNESFAACGCYQNKTQSYFVDHDPLSGSFLCRNKNQNHCPPYQMTVAPPPDYCEIVKRNPEWTLVFKAISGNGERVYDAWKKDLSKLSSCDTGLGCLSEDDTINTISPTSRHLTSELIKQWTSINVQKVKLELYSKGNVVMQLVFNGEGSDSMDWFNNMRLIYSTYEDMHKNSVYNYFSIQGFYSATHARRFHINSEYHGCPGDVGWLTVVDSDPPDRCGWETNLPLPQFLYSKSKTVRNWNSGDIGFADMLAIFVLI